VSCRNQILRERVIMADHREKRTSRVTSNYVERGMRREAESDGANNFTRRKIRLSPEQNSIYIYIYI